MYSYRKKNIIMIVMIVAIFLMSLGYAILSTTLNISGVSDVTGSWGIEITNVVSTPTGSAYNISNPIYENTTMTFDVGVKVPGDKMTFTVTVTNSGNIDAILESIDASASGSSVIIYNITGIQNQERLKVGASKTFTVTTEFDINATSIPNDPIKDLTITLNYIQDNGQTLTPSEPEINQPVLLSSAILRDNNEQSDEAIDFSTISSDTNGKGLYYTSTNTEDNKTTYYYRGAVDNNYVQFGSYKAGTTVNGTTYNVDTPLYWRIIRINEDGSIRLIYNGTSATATGINAKIGENTFNTEYIDNAYVGYMYGTAGSSTYALTHANTNDSTMKSYLDDWYEANLKNSYGSYLADAGFCNDRSLSSGTGIGKTSTYYGAYERLQTNKTPQFACPNASSDLFTLKGSNKGNKALDNPIGLITADEVAYAGGVYNETNESMYLSGVNTWTMSPFYFFGGDAYAWVVSGGGIAGSGYVDYGAGVRPVINLKSTVEIVEGGTGTSGNPYVIK